MTLVSILGDFHSSILPVYYQFRNNIKNHIIIYDDFKCDVKEAKNIIKGIKNFNKKYNLDIKTHIHCIDEDSYEAINKTIEFIESNSKKISKLYINTTDGLSNINTLIGLKLLPLGANLISYDRFDNEVNIISSKTMKTYKVDQIIPIQDHFLLRNIVVDSVSDKKYAKKFKNEIFDLFEKRHKEFKIFANYVQESNNPNIENKDFKSINKIMKKMGLENLKTNQSLITGGLFEYYIYLKLLDLDYDDIEIGVSVKKYIDEINFIPNEFDILIMKENHLHMIECKFTKNIKLENIVYKYMGLKSLLDDDGKMCILTSHKNPINLETNKNPMDYQPYKRASANKILLKGNPLNNIDKFILEIRDYFQL
ncbi:Card1-like endonuclease domain-containing protein [Poseidonibacter sp.]|uniref:Card1-like endonuclease domain-containing protein n=1 Tax=Poseidonibacter sp. TaxID=2321188 RepID=UPI003C758305